MKYEDYIDLGIVSAKKPQNSHLWFELNSGMLYLVDLADPTKMYYSDDKGLTWTQLDVDPSDSSGDNKSRDHKIQAAWHDRVNEIIYFIDCDNDGTADDFDGWNLDYSGSETAPTITEVDTMPITDEEADTVYAFDVFKIGVKIYGLVRNRDTDAPFNYELSIWDITANPFVKKSSYIEPDLIVGAGHAVVVGTNAYFTWEEDSNFNMSVFDGVGFGLTREDTDAAYEIPTSNNLRGLAYDGTDLISGVAEKTADGKNYLFTYSITSTEFVAFYGEHNVSLMLDRNTVSGVKEKAFHLTEYEVYQIQENKTQLYLIAIPETDAVIIAITDNFLMNDDGDMWEFTDYTDKILTLVIDHQIQESSHAVLTLTRDTIPIAKNKLMIIRHEYTTAGSTSEDIIFEGIVSAFTERSAQTVWLVSPAKREIKTTKPSGDFTVDSDGLISSIISTYFNYITEGTLTDGADLGIVALGGDQIAETIFDGCGQFEGFIWYLTPTGKLYFNNGTVDSTINYTEASGNGLRAVDPSHLHEEFNRIKVRGAYVAGVRVESDWQEDLDSQQRIGINERIFTISFLNTTALCNTAATIILTILAKDPKKVKFLIHDTTVGYIQVGETITFECTLMDITIASDQYLIQSATINKYGEIVYTITNELT